MYRVKFYSEYDMACGWELEKVIELINENAIEKEWTIIDLIEFYNILKYINIERFSEYINQKLDINIIEFKQKIQQKIGEFIGKYKNEILNICDELDFSSIEDFLEIIENYSIYKEIKEENFRTFINKEYVHICYVLKFKKLTNYFDRVVKEKILCDSSNAESVVSKYLDGDNLYLPSTLSEQEILTLIDDYIDSCKVNINVLRNIITFPTGKGINITDKIKLHAKRKEKDECEKIFNEGTGIESSVLISYNIGQEDAIIINQNGVKMDIQVSRKWIEENLDYPTLWNNFIHLFNVVDDKSRVTVVSKKNEIGVFESGLLGCTGNYLYNTSYAFEFKEMIANAEIYSYVRILNALGIRIEKMIEWFFKEYLLSEFSVSNFTIKMPTEASSYFEKCRTVLPEIDRIFKQYNVLIEDGDIDQELIQISSSSVKNKDIKSFVSKKYVYALDGWYQTASFLLFSTQSSIFYIPNKNEKFENFIDLITRDNVRKSEFQEYQCKEMKWLFDNNLIFENKDGFIKIVDEKIIYILAELYYEEVLNYCHYPNHIKKAIDDLENKKIVTFESSLFSRNEQDYLDYYLNKTTFTNGYDIRNRYLHGTNTNDENQYEKDYYLILKLLIIIIIKINDDLCINDDYLSND